MSRVLHYYINHEGKTLTFTVLAVRAFVTASVDELTVAVEPLTPIVTEPTPPVGDAAM